jgi:coenzyme F420-reducing hydrogenase gamma subunit
MSNDADDIAARLGHVEDDVDAMDECRRWLAASMHEGVTPDELLTQLIGNGWPVEQAEQLVEEVRRKTRDSRSVLGERDRIAQPKPRPTKIRYAPGIGAAIAAKVVLAAGRAIERKIGAEADLKRARVQKGLCHECANDVRGCAYQCPYCGAPIVGPNVL